MGIESLHLKGFRSLRDVQWRPGRLNLVIGPNGSGKSSLLQALDLLRAAAAGTLPEEILEQGGIVPLLWDGRAPSVSWMLKTTSQDDESFTYELSLQRQGTTGSFRVEKEVLRDSHTKVIDRDVKRAMFLDGNQNLVEAARNVPEEQAALSRVALSALISPAASRFHDLVAGWSIYHDLYVGRESSLRQTAVTRFEKRIARNGQNLIPVLHTLYTEDLEFRTTLDQVMNAAFGPEYKELSFPPAGDQRIQLRLRWHPLQAAQSAADLPDGVLRLLLLTAILANPEPVDLIAIDEPENFLHPRLLPIIAELAAQAAERSQVIFTTHSPHFLDAFKELEMQPVTTVAEWADGATRLTVLDNNDLRRWLEYYSLGDLFLTGELEAMA